MTNDNPYIDLERPMFYAPDGSPLTTEEWSRMFAEYPRPTFSDDVYGTPGLHVSSVWLGLDHSLLAFAGPPLIFETAVFEAGELTSLAYMARCATEEDLEALHKETLDYACTVVNDGADWHDFTPTVPHMRVV